MRQVRRERVGEGRVLVVSADSSGRGASLLNGVFGWSLSMGSTSNGYTASKDTAAADGTAFESAGPATLYGPNGNYALTTSSVDDTGSGSSIYTYVVTLALRGLVRLSHANASAVYYAIHSISAHPSPSFL